MIDELLVHISAPTTRQSDQLYQSLAEAYLGFDPHGIRPGISQQNNGSSPCAPTGLNDAAAPDRSSFRGTADTSIISASKDSYGSFPSYPSFDGVKAPTDGAGRFGHDGAKEDLSPVSSPLAQPEHTDRNEKGQRTLKLSSNPRNISEDPMPSSPDDVDMGFVEDSQVAPGTLPSELQDIYLLASDGTSEIDQDEKHIQDDTVTNTEKEENTPIGAMETNGAVPQRRRSLRLKAISSTAGVPEPASKPPGTSCSSPTKRQESVYSDDAPKPTPASQHAENVQETPIDTRQFLQPVDFSNLQIDAYPPEPKVSTARPGTLPSQITAPLAAIKEQNPTRFKPIRILNKPKADDRGYWLVGCSHWPAQLQQVFWTKVSEQVSSGRLGWGVTLYRESFTSRSLGKVKLYCWGEVIEHMWLVLWLCSKGQVSGSGLKWIDADGNEALVMS